jgi:hypothetical protein
MVSFDHKREISFILSRRDHDGGFPEIQGGDYRPDATAWVTLCLDAYQTHSDIAAAARAKLRSTQKADGSIPLSVDHPEAFWPTFPSVLAFSGDPEYKGAHAKAIDFLVSTTGRHSPNLENDPTGHDTTIQGWPWIDQTHSWVEPTSMAVRALTEAGLTNHDRTRDGIKLLLDRQLTDGGWNYGNTTVYGQLLNPMPGPTGMALWALADHVELSQVTGSLKYLQEQLGRLKTPLSLGWALKGLSSWNIKIEEGYELAFNCLGRQQRNGPYNTSHVAILLLAMVMLDIQESANV